MAISDTSFFNNYQSSLGVIYSKNLQTLLDPSDSYQALINTRQNLLTALSTTEVTNGIIVVNSSLQAESSMQSLNNNAITALNSSLNSFFQNQYGFLLRDFFTGLGTNNNIPWTNSFKDSWQKTTSTELVQQLGFATWTGSSFVFYPPISNLTNTYNIGSISSTLGNNVTFSSYSLDGDLSNFALPGYYVVAYDGSFPSASAISLSTSVVSLLPNNTLQLNQPIGSATSMIAFRPLQNSEFLEFRWGSNSVTGTAATSISSPLVINVTLYTVFGLSTTSVSLTSTVTRANIGIYNQSIYKATGIASIGISTGSVASLGTQASLEIWVKSNN
jgi:hypothetical protein